MNLQMNSFPALSWFRTRVSGNNHVLPWLQLLPEAPYMLQLSVGPTALVPVFLHPLFAPLTLTTLYKSSFIEASSFEPGGGPFYFLPGR